MSTFAVEFLREAKADHELAIDDFRDAFGVSYETAAHRFTNLATRHLGVPVHFMKVHEGGTLHKAYEKVQLARRENKLDQTVDTVERLIDVFRRTAPLAVVPRFGTRRGHPIIWASAAFAELEESDAATRDGARAVLRAHQPDIREVPVDDPATTVSMRSSPATSARSSMPGTSR